MTYVFIINPGAGRKQQVRKFLFDLQVFCQTIPQKTKVLLTSQKGHAGKLAAEAAREFSPARIYACGGDGTLNEVLQGVAGHAHVELGCIPIGSGNDFMRNFSGSTFLDLNSQIYAPSKPIDYITADGDFGERAFINVASLAWESRVAIDASKIKQKMGIQGSASYMSAVFKNLIRKQAVKFSAEIDGQFFPPVGYIIAACGNGRFYGGGFEGMPRAVLDDGLMDIVLVKDLTRLQVAKLFPKFRAGLHRENEKEIFGDKLQYYQARELKLFSDEMIPITLDGEEFHSYKFTCKIADEKIRFIIP